ncbi:hypothetical protein [Chroococcidiopsis thermalis]|uniref:hypothetical protein n=1 Tax=Chroococcidiopsis thermalis TaxID=54299 RepID=UPI00031C2146|nr:hypothetical protein [Chroococcidiopsis thermalis]
MRGEERGARDYWKKQTGDKGKINTISSPSPQISYSPTSSLTPHSLLLTPRLTPINPIE